MLRNPAETLPHMIKGDLWPPNGAVRGRTNFESHTPISQTVAPNGLPSLFPRRNFICPHFEGSEVVFAKRRRERHVCCVASARH